MGACERAANDGIAARDCCDSIRLIESPDLAARRRTGMLPGNLLASQSNSCEGERMPAAAVRTVNEKPIRGGRRR